MRTVNVTYKDGEEKCQETALQVAHVEAVKNVLDSLAASSTETENYKALAKEAQGLISGSLYSDEEK